VLSLANKYFYIPEFSNRINLLCQRQHMSLYRLARKAGISDKSLYRACQNKTCIGLRGLIKLSKTYHVSVDWLIGNDFKKG